MNKFQPIKSDIEQLARLINLQTDSAFQDILGRGLSELIKEKIDKQTSQHKGVIDGILDAVKFPQLSPWFLHFMSNQS